ncbi:hypothetical protein [Mycobacterium persicum]|uniref:hypothetical protein n=1 Tax=Mycobacterium persicum TaxID=1487726 RepID=UPI001593005D|nr:hypothetical protein [Mycobacterium persicum]
MRIGNTGIASRGGEEDDVSAREEGRATALADGSAADVPALRARVTRLAREFPLYEGLEDWSLAGR